MAIRLDKKTQSSCYSTRNPTWSDGKTGRVRLRSFHWLAAIAIAGTSGGELAADEATAPASIPAGSGIIEEFLACEFDDGRAYKTFPAADEMPWRVSIGMPKTSPKRGSRTKGREAAIGAMRQWEQAIQTRLPWFRLEFVKRDRAAPVQITWKRRTTGSAQGRAGPTCRVAPDRVYAGGRMEIAVQACPTCGRLSIDEIRMLVAHEFGHVLGLGHCLDCDSAMNYSFETRERVFVTAVDVDAVVHHAELAAADRSNGGMSEETPDR